MASNKEVEKKAIEIVLCYEKKQRRQPQDVSAQKLPWDIVSGGLKIEVKGAKGGDIIRGFVIEQPQYDKFTDGNFRI